MPRLARKLLLLLPFLAAPVFSYTIYLQDGTRILAKEKYVVQGDRALVTLPSGQTTMLPLSEIDVARTEAANRQGVGTALVIEGGKAADLVPGAPPPKKPTLQDLIQQTGKEPAPPPPVTRPNPLPQAGRPPAASAPEPRPARRLDPAPAAGPSTRNARLGEWLSGFLAERKSPGQVSQTGSQQIRVVIRCSNESAVLRAVVVAASALDELDRQFPGEVTTLRLELLDPAGGSAGNLTLSRDTIRDLLAGRIDPGGFFVRHVEF